MSTLEITCLTSHSGIVIEELREILNQVLNDHSEQRTVACILTDNAQIQQLNRDYRQIDKKTDVLSFELSDPIHPDQAYLGDVYISVEQAQEQATEHQRALHMEIVHLAVHGTLHLLGFEHDTEAGYQKMRAQEVHYLNRVQKTSHLEGE